MRHRRGARAFDVSMLAALLALTIEPTLAYDARPHKLSAGCSV